MERGEPVGSRRQIIDAIKAKQARNEARTWPDWRTAAPGKAIEHLSEAVVMTTRHHSPDARQAAIDDYRTSGDTYATVAARHHMTKSYLHELVNPRKNTRGGRFTWAEDEIAYQGGWEIRGGISYPLLPEQRSA